MRVWTLPSPPRCALSMCLSVSLSLERETDRPHLEVWLWCICPGVSSPWVRRQQAGAL